MNRWGLRLLLVTCVTLALLGATEALSAATGLLPDPSRVELQRMTPALEQDAAGRMVADATRWYTTAAGFRHSAAHLGREATAEWPFRGRPGAPLPAAVALPRVLIVGDSCVYGTGLDACDTLGWRLQLALDAHGLPPDRVAVIPLGVPGYSTEQLLPLLREGLDTLRPVAVVLYPAAWNDQAPAVVASDRALFAELKDPGPLDWLRRHTRLGAALLARSGVPQDELIAGWEAGHPPRGWRVPAMDVETNVAAMIAACLRAGSQPVVIAPPHPDATLRNHPRTADDARAVLAAAGKAGVPAFDGQTLLAAAGGDPSRFFSDYVHPSPEAVAVLVAAIEEPVERIVREALESLARDTPLSCAAMPIEVLDVQPREAFALGDVTVHLRLDNWNRVLPPPVVLVGGAPLIGVHAVGMQELEGTLSANGAGLHDVLVQNGESVGLLRGGMRLLDPELRMETGPRSWLVIRARPGDRLRLLVAGALRDVPQWSFKGALRLAADARPLPQDIALDDQGRAAIEVPALPPGRVLVQTLWAPAGDDLAITTAARWTGVVELGG